MRVGNTVAAAIGNSRVLEPVEANIALIAALLFAGVGALAFVFPRAIAYPIAVFAAWLAGALLFRGLTLYRSARK